MLIEARADVHATDRRGRTPLQYCAFSGRGAAAEQLRARGAELETRNPFGQTPLLNAALCGRAELLRFLLQRGADATATGIWEQNALHCAGLQKSTPGTPEIYQKTNGNYKGK